MQIIASDTSPELAAMLDGYEHPAILVTADYRILAANQRYLDSFGSIPSGTAALCHRVSHGFEVPCDQAGEHCPLQAAQASGERERVLHIHQTPRGREHVDVELLPIKDSGGRLKFFVELLKPVTLASPEVDRSELVGTSAAFNNMVAQITRVASSEAAVLLLGESGTGKELAARAIHLASRHQHRALVTLECAGLTATLFESELFGHVKGAFTGANSNKTGLAEAANGGTLFLDEIGDVPLDLQVKLLRLLETGTYRPVGSTEARRTAFRLVTATHKDLPAMVARGEFRQDLYFRINVFPIRLPALRERLDDIPLLAQTMLKRLDGERQYTLTESALGLLGQQHFSGNIRELRNIVARAVVLTNTNVIDRHVIARCLDIDRPIPMVYESGNSMAGARVLDDRVHATSDQVTVTDLKSQERGYLQALLARCGGDKHEAARQAGISVRTLYRKLAATAGISRPPGASGLGGAGQAGV